MRYMVVIECGEASWGAHVPDLPGCIAVGETRDAALRLIGKAIELHIQALEGNGVPVPLPNSEGEFVEVGATQQAAPADRLRRQLNGGALGLLQKTII